MIHKNDILEKLRNNPEPIEVTKMREHILDSFKNLEFIEEGHKYFIHNEDGTTELPSVSNVIHQFGNPFDDDQIAENYAIKNGFTKEYWLDQWKYNSLKATTLGTQVHLYAECYSYVKNNVTELIPDEFRYRYNEEKNWLIPIHSKEESAKKFWDEFPENLWWVLSETQIYTSKYAGTFDLLAYYKHPTDDSKSGLVILDYKTNVSLTKDYSRNCNKMLLPPFENYYDEPLGIYTLQLGLYQIPLENLGYKIIGRRLIHLKEDGYELIPIADETKQLREILFDN